LVLLLGCSKKSPSESSAKAKEPSVDPAVVAAAASTRCLVNRVERYEVPFDVPVFYEQSTVVARGAALAVGAVPRLPGEDHADPDELLSVVLAELGDLEGAREARARLRGASTLSVGMTRGRDLLLGDDAPAGQLELTAVAPLVIAGQRARAEQVLAEHLPTEPLTNGSAFRLGIALGALGKTDDLKSRIGAAEPLVASFLAAGWLSGTVRTGKGVDAAVAAAVDAVRAHEATPDLHDVLVFDVLVQASVRGYGPATKPLREAVATRATGDDRASILGGLHEAAVIGGAEDAELDTLTAMLDTKDDDKRARLALVRKLWRGPLDEALDAIVAYPGPAARRVEYLAMLWGKHVRAGFDGKLEARLAAAACETRCLSDRAAGASLTLTDAGGLVGDAVVVPATADRAAAATALAPALDPACGLARPDRATLTLAITPSARADVALRIAGGALDAGFASVTWIALPSPDAAAFEGEACVIERTPPRAPPDPAAGERVVLSILVTPESTWVGQSRINEFVPIGPDQPTGFTDAAASLSASHFFVDRKDGELAVQGDVTATALTRLAPLCRRFPALQLLAPDELTAKPAR